MIKKCNISIRSIIFVVAFVSSFMFISCSSQMERDAKEMAKRAVEFKQTQDRFRNRSNLHGRPMSREELEEYSKDYIEYSNKMLKKYGETREKHDEFTKLVNEEIQKLK